MHNVSKTLFQLITKYYLGLQQAGTDCRIVVPGLTTRIADNLHQLLSDGGYPSFLVIPSNGDLKPYLKVPMMVLWGDYVETSSRWAPRLKACREFAEAATKAGGRVQNVVLPELGIKGNSHMLMQDDNSLELADWLLAWIEKNIGQGGR